MSDFRRPLVSVHQAVVSAGYRDVVLDFAECTAAFPGPILALCAQVMKLRGNGIGFELHLPGDANLQRLFLNANWAHFLDPRKHDPSNFRGHTQLPATQYRNPQEQQAVTNRVANSILGAIGNIERSDFAALEWSLNEITDNVLVHSSSAIGGLVQVSTFQKVRRRLTYVVADAGLGIPVTLRQTHPEFTSDMEALNHAIREGVTRDKSIGQGNGLFGSYEICAISEGNFEIESGYASLTFDPKRGLHVRALSSPYEGTLVVAMIDFSKPGLLQEALKFGGRRHAPTDYIELKYERDSLQELVFRVKEEAQSTGSRVGGTPVRRRLENLAKMCPTQQIVVDFQDVPIVSSSFADEVFGKLFLEWGPIMFGQRLKLINVDQTVRMLLDRAIAQRLAGTK